MLKRLLILLLWISWSSSGLAYNPVDSLQRVLQQPDLSDSLKAVVLNELSYEYHTQLPQKADSLANEAIQFAYSLTTSKVTADSYYNMSLAQWALGNYGEALQHGFQALELYKQFNQTEKIADTYNQIGIVYADQSSPEKALEYLFLANDMYKALENQSKLAGNFHHIGIVYYQKDDPARAVVYYRGALEIRQELNDVAGIAESLTNMGSIFYDLGQYDKAVRYHQRAREVRIQNHNNVGLATNYRHLGYIFRKQGDFDSALTFLGYGQTIADSLQNKKERLAIYRERINLLEELERYRDAFEIQKQFIALEDSMFNLERNEQLIRLQTEFQTLQRQQENDFLKEQNEFSEEKLRNQSFAFVAILALLFVTSMLGYISWKNAKRTRQNNKILSKQKNEIESQHEIIEAQNREITKKSDHIESSIRYAKRIQTATLPKLEEIQRVLRNCMIFYKPRDIVSGDFYWFTELKPKLLYKQPAENEDGVVGKPQFQGMSNSKLVMAAVDCTGHGVPGAFMSMLGEQMLEKIVIESQVHEPGLILDMLHRNVRLTLKQEQTNNRDGMDMALCVIDKKSGLVEFAGAKNPLIYIQDNEITEIRGSKMSIAGKGDVKFTTHYITVEKPITFYMFSDGFKDQFGGDNNRKFGSKKFKELLLSIHPLPMHEQNQILNDTFMQWIEQAGEKQIDDILVIGFKLSPPSA